MKPLRLVFYSAVLILTFLLTFAASTAWASTSKPKVTTPPPPVDTRILIKSVDVTAGTVVIQVMKDKSLHTYTIDDMSVVKVNDSIAKIADVKAGMQVHDYAERDHTTLDTLTVN